VKRGEALPPFSARPFYGEEGDSLLSQGPPFEKCLSFPVFLPEKSPLYWEESKNEKYKILAAEERA